VRSHELEVEPAFVPEAEGTVVAAWTSKTDYRRVIVRKGMARLLRPEVRLYVLLARLGHYV
jgi:hypothetical protein